MFSYYGVAIILAVFLCNVEGEDPTDVQRNLSQVFRDFPTLFQHIVDMLHEKPEILERDDITTFLETPKDKQSQLISDENRLIVNKRESKFNVDNDFSEVGSFDGAEQDIDWYFRKVDDDYSRFLSSMVPGASQLTSDEVAELMIMVERKLEEYYNDTK